jgi:hypothetical protein
MLTVYGVAVEGGQQTLKTFPFIRPGAYIPPSLSRAHRSLVVAPTVGGRYGPCRNPDVHRIGGVELMPLAAIPGQISRLQHLRIELDPNRVVRPATCVAVAVLVAKTAGPGQNGTGTLLPPTRARARDAACAACMQAWQARSSSPFHLRPGMIRCPEHRRLFEFEFDGNWIRSRWPRTNWRRDPRCGGLSGDFDPFRLR